MVVLDSRWELDERGSLQMQAVNESAFLSRIQVLDIVLLLCMFLFTVSFLVLTVQLYGGDPVRSLNISQHF